MTIKRIALHTVALGIGGRVRVICLQLKEFTARGIRVLLILDKPLPIQHFALPDGVEVQVLPPDQHTGTTTRTVQLLDVLRDFNPDVYYDHAYEIFVTRSQQVVAEWVAIKRDLNTPVFVHWHNFLGEPFYLNGTVRFMAALEQAATACDGIIVLSRADQAFFHNRGFRAFYVPNPIDDQLRQISATSGLNTQTVLWVGRLNVNVKRPQDALAAFARIHAELPTTKMVLVGSGNDRAIQIVVNKAEKLGLTPYVEFVFNQTDVYSFYAQSSLLLQTTRFEGFPMIMIEAMAHALPIVSYDLPYLETVRDNAGAISVKQGDVAALAEQAVALLKSPDRLVALSSASREAFIRIAQTDHSTEVLSVLSGERHPVEPDAESRRIAEKLLFHECAARFIRDDKLFQPLKHPAARILLGIAACFSSNWRHVYKWTSGKYTSIKHLRMRM